MTKPLVRMSRGDLRTWTLGQLITKQNGLCAICHKPIDMTVKGNKSDYVVDHCHETGEVRSVLHRSCNAAEGKVVRAAGAWGAKSMAYNDVIPWLTNLLTYLNNHRENGTGLMYPDHKTPEQAANLTRKRRNEAAAKRRALVKAKKFQQEQN